MTPQEAKARLERYAGLKLELNNRLQHLAMLQQRDRQAPLLHCVASEEYARKIAPLVQTNRRELAAVEAAVNALADPQCREVLRLRYMEPSKDPKTGKISYRLSPWKDVVNSMGWPRYDDGMRIVLYRHKSALQHLAEVWAAEE